MLEEQPAKFNQLTIYLSDYQCKEIHKMMRKGKNTFFQIMQNMVYKFLNKVK